MTETWYKPLPKRGKYITCEPLTREIGRKGSNLLYTVPTGFPFDASVPRPLTWLFDPCDKRFMQASCLHDHTLENGWDRTTAGGVFNHALRDDGVSKLKRFAMFTAVVWYKWGKS